ncbi:MAG: polysaccharide deacetylase family protein [Candidatus Omnitrophota bacterium]
MFKRKRLIIIVVILGILAASLINFVRGKYVIPILMYHSISPDAKEGESLAITPEIFRKQMRFLQDRHYNIITLEEAVDIIKNKKRVPVRPIVITFDDGYKDNYNYAFPVLKEYNFPATLFIIINEVGRAQADRVSWDEIKTMQASGLVDIGSHTVNHSYLVDLSSQEEIVKEIRDSKKILEDRLGCEIKSFSYPAGRFNERIRRVVVETGYKFAVATNPGMKIPDDDIFALKRLRISRNCANMFVFWVETSGYYNFIRENRSK